jgi:branched-chain amino acid transport system permease protein
LLVCLVLRSRYGLALFTIRDSEATAESAGVDSFHTKPGVLRAGRGRDRDDRCADLFAEGARISPEAAFSVLDWNVMFIVIIGGFGTIEVQLSA